MKKIPDNVKFILSDINSNIMNNYIERLSDKLNDDERKIDKAIEYIEEHTEKINKRFTIPKIDFNYNDLLNILQNGSEKDE